MDRYFFNSIRVDIPESKSEIQNIFLGMLTDKRKNIISFINPEIMMNIGDYNELREYFELSRYNFVDGIGILSAINYKTRNKKYTYIDRYPGTDFFSYLPNEKNIKVFLFGAKYINNAKATSNIMSNFKNISVVGNYDGYTEIDNEDLIGMINRSEPDVVIVCLGCPSQERWIMQNYEKIESKIIFGNGGSIDFWSGSVKRAPAFFIEHKLEWLYRLFQDLSWTRIMRQLRLIKFALNSILRLWKIEENKENIEII